MSQVCGCMAIQYTGPAMTAGSTLEYALRLTAIDLGHKLGHSECLEHVIYKAEYITWTDLLVTVHIEFEPHRENCLLC